VSDVVLALIGPRWLTATGEEGRWRLADENDLVRLEIATGLERNIRVMPVLLQGASMPRAKDLPGALAGLPQRNAFEIRDTHFDQDVAQLIDILAPTWRHKLGRVLHRRPVYAAAVLLMVVVSGLWLYPQIAVTPERARIQIGQMGLTYDPDTFVDRAKNKDEPAVVLFLKAGMNPDAEDRDGYSALMRVAAEGHVALAKTLVEKGADVNPALRVAARHGKTDMMNFLLSRKPSPQAISQALEPAAREGHISLVRTLINSGAEVKGEDGSTALMSAVASKKIDVVQLLLGHGGNVHAVNSRGETALHHALRYPLQSIEIVRALLQQGANVNARDNNGTTPLMRAMQNKTADVALLLLEHNADATAKDRYATTLMHAAANNQASLIEPLVARGADINARNDEGQTALIWATRKGKPEVVQTLLVNGADINAVDKDGWTALMFAGSRDNADMARILLSRGADPDAKSKKGQTALMIAIKAKSEKTAKVLSEAQVLVEQK
jgi:ankyrin repeat protein